MNRAPFQRLRTHELRVRVRPGIFEAIKMLAEYRAQDSGYALSIARELELLVVEALRAHDGKPRPDPHADSATPIDPDHQLLRAQEDT